MSFFRRYSYWLHTQWPAGTVEKLPRLREDGTCGLPGVIVTGDLTGIPLLKFAVDSGAKAARRIAAELTGSGGQNGLLDLAIVGGGVSGMAAALEARRLGLRLVVIEEAEPFATIANFPKGKPIYTYPTAMTPAGDLRVTAAVKEDLLTELRAQTAAQGIVPRQARAERLESRGDRLLVHLADGEPIAAKRVIIAIGKSGNHRRLGVPGEELDKVYNRLVDPADHRGQEALVVGGGDSALETAIALAEAGARVTLSYRQAEFSRPKPDNREKLAALTTNGAITLAMATEVKAIREHDAALADADGREQIIANDIVFAMIGREPPVDFFRRSGIAIDGERGWRFWSSLAAILVAATSLYLWKGYAWGPFAVQRLFGWLGGAIQAQASDPATLLGTLNRSMSDPGFYYTLAYSALVVVFGWRRIRRRRTPYITAQTWTLMLIQVLPLFILPYLLFPWMGSNGWFGAGFGKWFADTFMPNESYWRAFGFILAWPLFVYNIFTAEPLVGWLVLGAIQTFVLIPAMVYVWGKGAYCGWLCSCGALAETLGDTQRRKMPHGPFWNRLNLAGQVILAIAFALLAWRIAGWLLPADNVFARTFEPLLLAKGWKPVVDLGLAGILGVGVYVHFSGRVWCRFFCPLAALMHIYHRFSRFRILADKQKCISCNLCTTVCHQGIDVMSFANKGAPMADPECVRCSACVHVCPTGVLSFGQVNPATGAVIKHDRLAASPVRQSE